MPMLLKISIRDIFKNSRRSMITILAIALGFAAINLFQGYVNNTYARLINAAIQGEGLGHLTVYKKGFTTEGKLQPEKYMFSGKEIESISGLVRKMPEVKLITPRLDISGIISNGKSSTIFIAQGLVPEDDLIIRGDIVKLSPVEGELLSGNESSGALISSGLAKMLNLNLGDNAVLLSNTLDGMANALDIKIRGIFNTGRSATNDKVLLLSYRHAQDLYDTMSADRLVLLLNSERDTNPVMAHLKASLKEAGYEVEIKLWYELSDFYRQVKSMFDMIFTFIFSIVFVIVIMSVINTMSMSVMERTREIGTMRALGFKKNSIKALFSIEGALLGLWGSVLGLVFFAAFYSIIQAAHVTYIPPAASIPVALEIDVLPLSMVKNLSFMAFLSAAAAFFPARKASRMRIIDALGHV